MKRMIIMAAAALLICTGSMAQDNAKCKTDWKEKMMSEKIGFLTMELNLTPEEAQDFWPIYNAEGQKLDAAIKQTFKAYHSMRKALDEGKSQKEIEKCLEDYLAAQKEQKAIESGTAEQYKKVLPIEKVAKLYVAEEKFRRQHIRSLHHRSDAKKPSSPQVKK